MTSIKKTLRQSLDSLNSTPTGVQSTQVTVLHANRFNSGPQYDKEGRAVWGRWRTSARPTAVSTKHIAALAPFAQATEAQCSLYASNARVDDLAPGLIETQLDPGEVAFLRRGRIQVQTRSGFVLRLNADEPCARFPLPSGPNVISLFATAPASTLVTRLPERDGKEQRPPAPSMDEAEHKALAALMEHFKGPNRELPSLPDLALKIGRAIDDIDNSDDDVARLIQLDPSLSMRLISVVNSAAFMGTSKIKDIRQATSRLGRRRVRNLVYSCLMRDAFKAKTAQLRRHMEQLWTHSTHIAALCYVLARHTPGIDPEQALLAGLVHDIGAVAVLGGLNHWPVLARRDDLIEYVTARLSRPIGALTLRRWHLEDSLMDVIEDAHDWTRCGSAIPENPDVVILAHLHDAIGHTTLDHLPAIDEVPAFSKLVNGKLGPKRSLAVLEEAEADIKAVRRMISFG